MALDFNTKNVKDQSLLTVIAKADDPMQGVKKGQELWSPLVEALAHVTMGIGLGELTEKNLPEFLLRVRLWERCFGAMRKSHTGGKLVDVYFTVAELRGMVGFRTNVSPLTRPVFLRNLAAHLERDTNAELRK
jgi:hypothetical protein